MQKKGIVEHKLNSKGWWDFSQAEVGAKIIT